MKILTSLNQLILIAIFTCMLVGCSTRDEISELNSTELILLLQDEQCDIRTEAARELGRRRETAAVEHLIQMLTDQDPNCSFAARLSLEEIGQPAVSPLLEYVNHASRVQKLFIISILGDIGDGRAVETILDSLSDPDSSIRANAAEALGKLTAKDAIPRLILVLKDDDYSVRNHAAEALGRLRANAAVQPLISLLRSEDTRTDGGSHVAASCAAALARIGDSLAIPALVEALDEKNIRVLINLINALGELGDEMTAQSLLPFLDSQIKGVRLETCLSLGKLKNPVAVQPLIVCLSDKEWEVRAAAALSLKQVGHAQADKALKEFAQNNLDDLRQSDRRKKLEAIHILGEIKENQAVDPLLKILTEEDDIPLRGAAARALGAIGDARSVRPMIDALLEKQEERESLFYPVNYIFNNQKAKEDTLFCYDLQNALEKLTGKLFGEHAQNWLEWRCNKK